MAATVYDEPRYVVTMRDAKHNTHDTSRRATLDDALRTFDMYKRDLMQQHPPMSITEYGRFPAQELAFCIFDDGAFVLMRPASCE